MNLKDITDSWLNQTMTYLFKMRKPLKETELHLENRFETCLACPHMCTRSIPKANLTSVSVYFPLLYLHIRKSVQMVAGMRFRQNLQLPVSINEPTYLSILFIYLISWFIIL